MLMVLITLVYILNNVPTKTLTGMHFFGLIRAHGIIYLGQYIHLEIRCPITLLSQDVFTISITSTKEREFVRQDVQNCS